MAIQLPEILSMPPKMLPMVTDFNKWKYCLAEGGRGSGKTQNIARFLLFLGDKYKLRIVCGRETQNSIEESVYTVLTDLIDQYRLPYRITQKKLEHTVTGTVFSFKGFRDQGRVNIKGLEGVDIVWVDEAQSITKNTLDVLVPTIRKENSRLIFSMNKYMRDDAVPAMLEGREDCCHIRINYFDNPFCPLTIKNEAETLKAKSQKEYEHIYLGIPLDGADDYLFNYTKLERAYQIKPIGETAYHHRVLAIDFAAHGNDQCVATVLDKVSNQHWKLTEQIAWDEPDSMISVGRIVNIINKTKPTISILDVGGMGHVVHNRLQEVGVNIQRFDGATVAMVDKKHYLNARAEAYYLLKDMFDQEQLVIPQEYMQVKKELQKIRMKFRSSGRRVIQEKVDMKKELGYSPDYADSLMMGAWAIFKLLNSMSAWNNSAAPTRINNAQGQHTTSRNPSAGIKRVSQSRRDLR